MKANNFAKFKDIYEENKDQRCTLTAHLHKVLYEENIINLVDLLNPEFKSFVGDQVKETLESIKKFREENPGYKGGAAEYHGELLPFIVDIYGQPLDRYGTIIKPRK